MTTKHSLKQTKRIYSSFFKDKPDIAQVEDSNLEMKIAHDPTKIKVKKESPVEVTHWEASIKKRKQQDAQKVAMLKRRQEALARVQGEVGDAMSIKMDPREATKAQALHGVIFEAVEDAAGGCQVVTVHGVISKDLKENHIYFIPADHYKVLEHGCTIPTKLIRIQETVLLTKTITKK